MKNWTKITSLLLCLLMAGATCAQESKDSKYLKGAVPEVDGKIVFAKEYLIPGMPKDEVFDRMLIWMEERLAGNENNSRVLYTDKEKGQIVGTGDDWIVFSSTAISLDRTRILYQLTVRCEAEKCSFRIEKINFIYREGEERYKAEEWIADKYALNKAQTKLVRGLAKWRRKTVDFAQAYFDEVAEALSAESTALMPEEEAVAPAEQPAPDADGPIVITTKKQAVTPEAPQQAPAEATPAPAGTTPATGLRETAPDALAPDAIQTGQGRLVIVIGTDPFNQTVMTADAGGSLGQAGGKAVVFTILAPGQAHGAMDRATEYEVRFYPNGATEPTLVLQCRKMEAPQAMDGMPRTYVGEILKAFCK